MLLPFFSHTTAVVALLSLIAKSEEIPVGDLTSEKGFSEREFVWDSNKLGREKLMGTHGIFWFLHLKNLSSGSLGMKGAMKIRMAAYSLKWK